MKNKILLLLLLFSSFLKGQVMVTNTGHLINSNVKPMPFELLEKTTIDSSYQKQIRSTSIASGVNLTIPSTLLDTTDYICIEQTVVSITYTLGTPTSTKSKTIVVVNKSASTQAFTCNSVTIPINSAQEFYWDGINWKLTAISANFDNLPLGVSTDSFVMVRNGVNYKIPKDSVSSNVNGDYSGVEQHSVGTGTNLSTITSTNTTTSGTLLGIGNRVVLAGATVSGSMTVNAANGTIAVGKTGAYTIIVSVSIQSAGTTGQWGQLVKNNATVIAASSAYSQASSAGMQIVLNYTGLFIAGDLIDVRLNSTAVGTIGVTGYSYSVVQASGFLPIAGYASNSQMIFNDSWASSGNNIGNATTGVTFTVPATGQYQFTLNATSFSTASALRTGTYQIRQGTSVLYSVSNRFYFNQVNVHSAISTSVILANLSSGVTYNVLWVAGTYSTDAADFFSVIATQVGLVGIAGSQINTLISPTNGQNLTWNGATNQYEPANDVQNITTNYNYNSTYDTINNYTFVDYTNLSFTNGHGQAFLKDGQLYAWGNIWKAQNGQVNTVSNTPFSPYKANGTEVGYTPFFKKISYTSENVYCIDQYNKVWSAGTDTWGQLGDGATTGRNTEMLYLMEYFTTNNIDVVDIQCNGFAGRGGYMYALSTTGNAYFCGNNLFGSAGDGTTVDVTTPKLVPVAAPVAKIRTGGKGNGIDGFQTFFIFTNSTTPQAVGYNAQAQLGDGTITQRNVPTTIPTLAGATDISCGGSFTGAMFGTAIPNVKFTGLNTNGNKGNGTTTASTTFVASTFAGIASKLYLFQSNANTGVGSAILDTARQLWVVGQNYQGWMGQGVATAQANYTTYFKPPTLPHGKIAEFNWTGTAGVSSYVRDTSGTVYAAGFNADGQSGQGNATTTFLYQNTWKKVPIPTPSVKILIGTTPESSGGGAFSVDKQGRFYQWGWQANMASSSNSAINNTVPHYVVVDGIAKPDTIKYIVGNTNWTENADIVYPTNINAKVSIGTTTPTSSLHVVGSQSNSIRVSVITAITLSAADYTVIYTTATGVPAFTLPAASTCIGRTYNLVNNSITAGTVSSYVSFTGTASTVIALQSGMTIQSDGTSWRRIN